MILVHAGNRVDGPGRPGPPRFPESQVAFLQRRLARFVVELRPRVVVSAAAAGADLLLLENALATPGVAVHVVLPFAASRFRETSVADRGSAWTERYDRVLAVVRERPDCQLVEFGEAANDAGYRAGNKHLIDHAARIAGDDGVLALAVRPRPGSAGASMTDDFVEAARLRGVTSIDIDPGIREADMRKAFVAMPFGQKTYKRRKVDCDATFAKVIVPVLEDADLDWKREDRRVDVGIIHVGMIEQLGNADIVVVDTIAANPNVFYELGLRHAFAEKTTILLGPMGTTPPFDTRPIRHFTYKLTGTAITDQDALEAIATLQPVFDRDRLAAARRDSPVFEFFEVAAIQTAAGKRLRLLGASDETPKVLAELHRRVSDAADRGNIADLTQLAEEIPAQPLDRSEQAQLLLIIGIALREHGQAAQAVEVLRPLDYKPADGRYELWAQQLAMALRRRGEGLAQSGGDPEPLWQEAQRLLDAALVIDKDPETCGIAGGLAKQRGIRELVAGQYDLGRAHLQTAADLYLEGAEAEPANFYVGLNAVTTLRILAQHLDGDQGQLEQAQALLPVVLYFAANAVKRNPGDFWAVVSVAELVLTAHLLGGTETEEDVIRAYARAATMRPRPDYLTSVVNQLSLYRRVGDPASLIDRIRSGLADALPIAAQLIEQIPPAASPDALPTPPTETIDGGKPSATISREDRSKSTVEVRARDKVFISYSHADSKWLKALQMHLAPYIRNVKIAVWDDTKIGAGTVWRESIGEALASAKVAVLLVSPAFLASSFIAEEELPYLLEAAKNEGMAILWIPVSYSSFNVTPIAAYQAAHSPDKPLASLPLAARAKAWVEICDVIQQHYQR